MLKPFASSPDEIPEAVREFYKPDESGVLRLQVAPLEGWELQDTAGLQKALSSERSRATTSTKELEAIKKRLGDLDLDELLSTREKYAELIAADPEKKVEQKISQRKAELEAQFAADRKKLQGSLEEREGVISSLENSIKSEKINRTLSRELAKHFDPEFADLVHAALRGKLAARQVEGKPRGTFEVVVLDESGEPATSWRPGKYAEDMSVDELVESAIEANAAWGSLRRGSPHKGTGALPSGVRSNGGRLSPQEIAQLPVAERLRQSYAKTKR